MLARAERLGHAGPRPARVVGEAAVGSLIAGVVMGVLWWVLAPDVTGIVVNGELLTDLEQGQRLFTRDAIFALLGAGSGLVLAIALTARHRRHPVTSLLALAAGGLAGSLLAQLIGLLLGPDGDVSGLADGVEHVLALRMNSSQALLVWPLVLTVVVGVIAVFREDTTAWAPPGGPGHGQGTRDG